MNDYFSIMEPNSYRAVIEVYDILKTRQAKEESKGRIKYLLENEID